jgi:Predicted Fe-S oxidoreductases
MGLAKNNQGDFLTANDYQHSVNSAVGEVFTDALKISLTNPGQAFFILKSFRNQKKAAKIRLDLKGQGVQVPPFAIVSITNRCNLRCKGCYAQLHHPVDSQQIEMDTARLSNIFKEAHELGIALILIAGGEPLIRKDILEVTAKFASIIFPVFTNGLLLDKEKLQLIKKQRNVIPVISMEGESPETDERRGSGVFESVMKQFGAMGAQGIFFGTSITLTRNNFQMVTGERFIRQLVVLGCKLFFFVEYIPVQEGTADLVLTEQQRRDIIHLMASFRTKYPGLFIAFPGDEEKFGGCLAAGRGFIHINASGGVEPCPFAPYSDSDLQRMSLKEALQSKLLEAIRENPDQLKEGNGGCALWENREWVRSLVAGEKGDT